MKKSLVAVSAASVLVLAGLVACAPPEKDNTGGETSSGVKVSEATSAADFGGMDALVEAAKKEGELNVIALPPDWANYGAIIKAFGDKYGIKVNSAQPDAASQDEINAANQQKGKCTAPDVFDLGQSVALANTAMFAPYKVATFGRHRRGVQGSRRRLGQRLRRLHVHRLRLGQGAAGHERQRSAQARVQGQGRAQRRSRRRPAPRSPGVLMVALSQGGSADDIAPGVEFFRKLKEAGNFLPVDPTPATIESGQTPVVIDWNYLNAAETKKLPTWQVVVPPNARRRRLLLPGDQQGRAASGGRAAVAGVPLQRRGPEPVRPGRCAAGARRHHDGRGHSRQGRLQPVAGHRRAGHRPVT